MIVPPGHHLAAQPAVTLEGLVAEPMLLQQEGSGVRSVVEAAMREGGLRDRDLHVAMELGLQQSVKAAVLDGFGITVISRLAVEREVAEGEPGCAAPGRARARAPLLLRPPCRADAGASRRRSSTSPRPARGDRRCIRPAYWKHRRRSARLAGCRGPATRAPTCSWSGRGAPGCRPSSLPARPAPAWSWSRSRPWAPATPAVLRAASRRRSARRTPPSRTSRTPSPPVIGRRGRSSSAP